MLFRYPGGKGKIKNIISEKIVDFYASSENEYTEFREPFFGAGAISFDVLKKCKLDCIWINDKDPAIAAIWSSVINSPDELKFLIRQYQPKLEDFYSFKEKLLDTHYLNNTDELTLAFQKIAIHQMSYSGLGTRAGSAIGGKNQFEENGTPKKYQIDCRWSVNKLVKDINILNKLFSNSHIKYGECTRYNYEVLIKESGNSFIYLDPPYYKAGQDLYQFNFDDTQHKTLSSMLKECSQNWILSYDNHERIRKLYDWAIIEEIPIKYSINGSVETSELLIYSKDSYFKKGK